MTGDQIWHSPLIHDIILFVLCLWGFRGVGRTAFLQHTHTHTQISTQEKKKKERERTPQTKSRACLYLIKVNERLLSSACRPAVIWYRSPRSGHRASNAVTTGIVMLITIVTIVATSASTLIFVIARHLRRCHNGHYTSPHRGHVTASS